MTEFEHGYYYGVLTSLVALFLGLIGAWLYSQETTNTDT